VEYPNLHGTNPATHPWTRLFQSAGEAASGLPLGTIIPTLRAVPAGYTLTGVTSLVNPSQEVLDVQVWYGREGLDPLVVGLETGAPDILVAYSRMFRGPHPASRAAGNTPIAAGMAERPVQKVLVRGRPGIYLAFDFADSGLRIGTRILDAIRWTAPDATHWTVQGNLPVEELLAIADEVYDPQVF
jgi:hypothetical protein